MTDPPDRHAGERWRLATLVLCLGLPNLALAKEPSASEIRARFAEGQERYGEKRYAEAAEIFAELLGQLEEVVPNRNAREDMMRNALTAYEWAYKTSARDDGGKDVALLDAGQRALDEYRAELSRVYGAEAAPSPELVEAIARYEQLRQEAHEADEPEEPDPPVGPCLSPPPPPPIEEGRGCGRDGDPSVAMLGLFALPLARRRRQAVDRLATRLPPDVVRKLRAEPEDDR